MKAPVWKIAFGGKIAAKMRLWVWSDTMEVLKTHPFLRGHQVGSFANGLIWHTRQTLLHE